MALIEQITLAAQIRNQLAAMAIEDEGLIHDTLEGETDIFECMDWLLRKIAEEDAMVDAIDVQICKLGKRMDSAKGRKERWRELLQMAMEAAGERTVKRPGATITLAPKPQGIQVADESLIPDEFFIVETIRKLDRKKLKEAAIEKGVAGVLLDNGGLTLRVRV